MTNNSPNSTKENYSVKFLIEEYKNIASTHDTLRDNIARIFNYFLILNAFPFTVAGFIFRDRSFNLFDAPLSLHLLFLTVGIADFFMGLSMGEARLEQFMYARTVNSLRNYFADLDNHLAKYLYLPISKEVPEWGKLGFVGKQVQLVEMVGAIFAAYSIEEILLLKAAMGYRILEFILILLIYCLLFKIFLDSLKKRRKQIHKKVLERLENK